MSVPPALKGRHFPERGEALDIKERERETERERVKNQSESEENQSENSFRSLRFPFSFSL